MIKKIVFGVLLFLGVGLFLFYILQEKFIFLNGSRLEKDYLYHFPQEFQEINLKTVDNQSINALHFTLPKPKGIILFFHGNKGNLERWGSIVPYLLDYNYEVFVIDYRNYGKSSGSFNEQKMYDDALLSYDYLKKSYSEENIVVYGRSLGATFAAKVASKNNPKHLVLEAPFYNMKRAIRYYFSLAPTFLVKYPFRTDSFINQVQSPVTIFHGNEDKTTSFKESKELFDLITTEKKEYVEIKTATHHNVKEFSLYQEKMKKILAD